MTSVERKPVKYPKPVHNIDSNGCGPPENWEKNFITPPQERYPCASDQRSMQDNQRGGVQNQGRGRDRCPYTFKPAYYMCHGSETDHRTKDCPIFLESKRKMEQDSAKPSQQSTPEKSITSCNGPSPVAILFILSFVSSNATLSEYPNPTSGILPILPLRHN
jgi:hypothetical protein